MDANYNRALNLLKSNPPEGRLDVQLPRTKYLQLEKAFLNILVGFLVSKIANRFRYYRYPSLSYDSFTETVTVVTCPGNIHESAALELLGPILADAKEYLSTYCEFEGSTKQPDGGESYVGMAGLCRSKDMWIDGHGVNVYMLLCPTEKPRFKNPTAEYGDIGDVKAAVDLMKSSMNETLDLNLSNNHHALVLYRGHKWAGELKDGFVEIWRAGTSIRSKYYLVQDGRL
ncbi:hypothetical protein V1517DRAFT_355291 [Lipomyces orientalis]|uniref:Uncharacterized protein n=1 Tax=Lipomyces orientalis TaxID=1233043 RepID=A0ACC3TDI5_9ASCO